MRESSPGQSAAPHLTARLSSAGLWYQGTDFPPLYENTYFHADYGGQWIKSFVFDANNELHEVRLFGDALGSVVSLVTHPQTGGFTTSRGQPS